VDKSGNDFQEFLEVFNNEEACRSYLFEMRWPDGFVCPTCNMTTKCWFTSRHCIACIVRIQSKIGHRRDNKWWLVPDGWNWSGGNPVEI